MSITPKMAIEECIGGQKIPSIIHSHRFLSLWGWNSTLPSFETKKKNRDLLQVTTGWMWRAQMTQHPTINGLRSQDATSMTSKKFISLSLTLTMGNIDTSKAAFAEEKNRRCLGNLFLSFLDFYKSFFFFFFCFLFCFSFLKFWLVLFLRIMKNYKWKCIETCNIKSKCVKTF